MLIEVKILDPRAVTPSFATTDSGAVDLVACLTEKVQIPPLQVRLIGTGISINMQLVNQHMAALILPRSGKGHKEGKVLGNLVGFIDQDYHGELMVSLWNRNSEKYAEIEPGERFAQLMFVPIIKPIFQTVKDFSSTTERGAGGFGSTG